MEPSKEEPGQEKRHSPSKSMVDLEVVKSDDGSGTNPQGSEGHKYEEEKLYPAKILEHKSTQSVDVGESRRPNTARNNEKQRLIFRDELGLDEHSNAPSKRKLKKNEKKFQKILQSNRTRTLSKVERKFLSMYLINKKTSSITDEQRSKLWLIGSGAETLRQDNPGYYKKLLDRVQGYPNPSFPQIHLDLHRTFGTDESFYTKEKEETLKRVLSAYVLRNPTVGYCQGLNFITAGLISQLTEEQTFWMLCQIIETLLPTDYFNLMTGVLIDQKVFETLLAEHFSDVHKHLKKCGFQLKSFTTQWFICIYANTLKLNSPKAESENLSIFDVWDYIFTQGYTGIFKVGLAIIGFLKGDILKLKDEGDLFMLFRECSDKLPKFKDLNKFFKKHEISLEEIKNHRLAFKEEIYQEYFERHFKEGDSHLLRSCKNINSGLEETLKEKFLRKIYLYNGISKLRSQQDWPQEILDNFDEEVVAGNSCDTNWPICLYDFFYQNTITRHFAFKNRQKINIIEDHFGESPQNTDSEQELQFTTRKLDNGCEVDFDSEEEQEPNRLDGLLLERNTHLCTQNNFEEKFKLLFGNKNSEFFIEALQSMYQDHGDMSYSEKCEHFISICNMLAEKVPLYEKGNISKEFFENLKELEYAARNSK
ncbi:unnamed protein product [Moneuplotes crassus]|uniref:Rab-GAP TBC domain-containing protein n=1 Tax=Euplotes crassus TaxID=5936 RepID=A0AAD1X7B2_EUPCR|nr:unnamed protein product [Moneuplotes crassus]